MIAFLITLYILAGLGCIPYLAKNEYKVSRGRYTSFILADHKQQAYDCTKSAAIKSIAWPYTLTMAMTTTVVENDIVLYEKVKENLEYTKQIEARTQKHIAEARAEQDAMFALALQDLQEHQDPKEKS